MSGRAVLYTVPPDLSGSAQTWSDPLRRGQIRSDPLRTTQIRSDLIRIQPDLSRCNHYFIDY